MIVLRLLAVFIFSALLSGCEKVAEDIKEVKAHIIDLKIDLLGKLYEPQSCPGPGATQPELKTPPSQDGKCHYELTITDPGDGKGLVTGKVGRSTIEKHYKNIPGFDPDKYLATSFEYHFPVVQGTPTLKKDAVYKFVGVPGTANLSCTAPCEPLPVALKQ